MNEDELVRRSIAGIKRPLKWPKSAKKIEDVPLPMKEISREVAKRLFPDKKRKGK